MAKHHAGAFLLVLVALVLGGGCSAGRASTSSLASSFEATGGSGGFLLADPEERLASFLACTSPAAFVELQRGGDMARLVEGLDDWSAVRLGALGPLLPEAAHALNRKRASFLVTVTQEYGVAVAEVFALFVLHSAFDKDVEQVLRLLAQDKRLGQTLGHMATAREHLRRRGFDLADYPDRPEHLLGDGGRGARQGAGEVVSSAPLFQTGALLGYTARKGQLPPPYRQALDAVESALVQQSLEPGNVVLGVLDELTFGVPLGFYYLAAGVGHGTYTLTQGQYEQATRELTPAALLVALYAGGKGARYLSEARGVPGTSSGAVRALQGLELRLEKLKATAERIQGQLGGEGLQELARYLRADPEAALLVAEGGEAGAVALYEARGNIPKAQAWLSQAKPDRPGASRTRGGAGKSPGGVASPPPAGATAHPLWSEYLAYGKGRVADLQQGTKVKHGRVLEPPLKWDGYQQMRGQMTRGLAFERDMAKLLREDAARPQAQRRFLQDFKEPRVETYVGVQKPQSGLRYADVLVIEQQPLPGQPSRVETFSFKSRDFSQLGGKALEARLKADASEALAYYGETLDIRRPGLRSRVKVERVRLIYEGGRLEPKTPGAQQIAVERVTAEVAGVEVLFQ